MRLTKPSILVLVALILSACGGESDPFPFVPDNVTLPSGPTEYREYAIDTFRILDRVETFIDNGQVAVVPTSALTYSGTLSITDDATVNPLPGGYIGAFTATFTPAGQVLDGEGTNFYYDPNDDQNVAGTGTLVAGTITVDGAGITAGTMDVILGGDLETQTVNGTGEVAYFGPNGTTVFGLAENVTIGSRNEMVVVIAGD